MERIYFDNAATTSLDPEVLKAMMPYYTEHFGNPSSIYSYGREARMAIEAARKTVANLLHVKPGEITFTSCGTESSNLAINAAIRDLGCTHIITSTIEHHATLHTVQFLHSMGLCEVSYVNLTHDGHIDVVHLEDLLKSSHQKTLVTLMHANNEVGNLSDIVYIGELCERYDAIFHSDTVQTLAHFLLDLQEVKVHFMSGSAHKFHGPKGSGILFARQGLPIKPILHGGSQERNMRAGTENVAGIVGFAKAFELNMQSHHEDVVYIRSLKNYVIEKLTAAIPDIIFHGDIGERSLYTVLNVGFPVNDRSEMLSINLDIAGICVSGGSACNSGAQGGSHVIKGIYPHESKVPIRFSFSKHNTFEEIDKVVLKISELL
ncbi:MAG: cysteine desulfurase [Bacteroidetes bacterium]|nr:cysteine desulfurase [Bacteroidota bacterium]